MTGDMDGVDFEIRESREQEWLRLRLLGELDMASAPILERRLEELRVERDAVLIDLSKLSFMDSSGLAIIIRSLTSASSDGWRFRIDADLAEQPRRLLHMTNVDRFITGPEEPRA